MASKADVQKLFPEHKVKKVDDTGDGSYHVEFKDGAEVFVTSDGTERWNHAQTGAPKPGETVDEDDD